MTDPNQAGGWDIGAKLDTWVELGRGIKHGIDRLNERWKAKPEVLTQRDVQAATSPSSGDFLIGLGGPAMGRRRMIRQLVIGGTLFSSTPGGAAYLLREATTPPLAAPLYAVVDFVSGNLPARAFYGRGEMVVDYPDKLYVLIHTPTATTQYVSACWFEDYELGEGLVSAAL